MRTVTFYGLAVVLAVLLDQAVKWAVEAYLPFHQLVPVLPFLGLFRTYNTGVAFSMFSGSHDLLLLLLALAVIGFVLYLAWKSEPGQRWARAGFTLVIGGAVGNLIDRGVHGHVIDYVLFHTPSWSFAVFNLADAFISVGAALVLLEEVLAWQRERRERKAADR